MIHIVIQHHNFIFREGLRTLLSQAPDLKVVDEARPQSLVELVRITYPGVVLVDGSRASALELTSQIHDMGVRGIFVLVPRADEEIFFEFFKRGAAAYELMNIAPDELLEKIRRVAGGECLMTGELFSGPTLAPLADPEGVYPEAIQPKCALSPRELEVLQLVARGMSNKMIANALGMSDQTVKNHMTSILTKFRVADRTAAVLTALRRHYFSLDDPSFEDMAPQKHRREDEETGAALERIAS